MPEITGAELDMILSGDPEELDLHLRLVDRDIEIDGHKVTVHCHCLTTDANGRVRVKRLVEFMRNAAADYAIPRKRIEEARQRDAKFHSTAAVSALHQEARAVFTDLATTGEGGEMLLFLLAERFLGLPHILCKMDLKTDTQMHYHGADGVYAAVTDDGRLKLYWGESKVYGDPTDAIRDCLASLAPFLLEEDHEQSSRERDLLLLSDKADLGDPRLSEALKRYFDKTSILSNRVEYCGVALVGFDADFYPLSDTRGVLDDMVLAAKAGLENWKTAVGRRLTVEKLEHFEVHFLCLPLPSVEKFREAFLEAMGLS
ncbi:HamA C-terminal domain-containing protein [Mesorhizobium sp. ArgA1]